MLNIKKKKHNGQLNAYTLRTHQTMMPVGNFFDHLPGIAPFQFT